MAIETFEDFESTRVSHADANDGVPFALRKDKSREGTLLWLNENFMDTYKESTDRLEQYRKWGLYFKNIYYRSDRGGSSKKPKMRDNYIWELITRKVGIMATKSTAITAIPWNWDDQNDINNAKSSELILKSRADEIGLDSMQSDGDFIKYKYGTAFFMQTWDKDAGGFHPAYQELYDYYKGNIPKEVKKQFGGSPVYRGDMTSKPVSPYYIFPEKDKKCWEEVNHYDYLEWINIHELKHEYPKFKDTIGTNEKLMWDMETGDVSIPDHLVAVRTFYHKPTKWLSEGAIIKYTDTAILEWDPYPYTKLDGLNLVIDREIKIEDELWGRPSIMMIEQHQRMVNNIESSIARDLGVGSAPKWLVPKNSVDFKVINNEFSVVEYRGAVKPELVTGNPVSSDAVSILDRKASRMSTLMRVTDVQKGNVPAGVTANSALRFLDEQADMATAEDDKARKRRIVLIYRQLVAIAAQYYQEDDDRVVRTLGPNNEYLIRSMKKADFSKVSSIQLQNTSAMPDTKTGKISTIIDMNMATQTDPVFKREEIVEMMGLGLDKKFMDQAVAAANTANALFQEAIEGNPLQDPTPSLNLMVYYSVFTKRIQDYGYITRVNPEIKQMIEGYLLALEMLLVKKSESNPKIQQWLASNDYFPMFYELPMPMELGEAPNTGNVDTRKMENVQRNIKEESEQDQGV